MRAGHPVTPSDEVDQAWHLHLLYTESYWVEMCGELLERPLHHGPTRGGSSEGQKFRNWYAETLASYERAFGHAPPPDIWPDTRARFRTAAGFRRVNIHHSLILPKPRLRLSAALALVALVGVGCASLATGPRLGLWGWLFPLLVFGVVAALVAIYSRGDRGSGCSAVGGGGCGGGGWRNRADSDGGDDGDGGGDGGSGCGGCGGCGG